MANLFTNSSVTSLFARNKAIIVAELENYRSFDCIWNSFVKQRKNFVLPGQFQPILTDDWSCIIQKLSNKEMMNLTRLEWGRHFCMQTASLTSLVAEFGKEDYKDLFSSRLKNRRKRYWYDCENEPQVL